MEIVLWLACGVMTVIAAVLASRSGRARYVGRAAVGGLFIVGGALVNTINLASGVDYTGFADTAHFTRRTQGPVRLRRRELASTSPCGCSADSSWWVVIMLPPMVLLRAERRAATAPIPAAQVEEQPLTGVGP